VPTALRVGPYRIHFYASDGDEPRHVHAVRDASEAKFWLDPGVSLARSRGFTRRELRRVQGIVETNAQTLRDAWDAFFNT
jgi:hypothetical protein